MPRYHPELGLPLGLRLPVGVFSIIPSEHAALAAVDDGVDVPFTVDTNTAKLFEVWTNGFGRAWKFGYRVRADKDRDICLVVKVVDGQAWLVLTCWVNHKDDSHRTLNPERYDIPCVSA